MNTVKVKCSLDPTLQPIQCEECKYLKTNCNGEICIKPKYADPYASMMIKKNGKILFIADCSWMECSDGISFGRKLVVGDTTKLDLCLKSHERDSLTCHVHLFVRS